jgi:RNA polymerase sigma-70 factor, ECF subfamily
MSSQDEAIAELKRGEMTGLASLVALHQVKALRTVYGILGDRAAAEDVVGEAFMKVVNGIARFDQARPFEPWFYRIVVNLAIDYRRKARRSEMRPDLLPMQSAPSADLDARELRIDVAAEIERLPRIERAVLVLRYYLDMDEDAMAAVLNCPVGTVKSRLHRARQRLRTSLSDPEHQWAPTPAEGA